MRLVYWLVTALQVAALCFMVVLVLRSPEVVPRGTQQEASELVDVAKKVPPKLVPMYRQNHETKGGFESSVKVTE